MASLGILSAGTLETPPVAWAGGQGMMSMAGTLGDIGNASVVILEDDHAGEWQPAGDAILHDVGKQVTFVLSPCNIRARINGVDSTTSVEVFVS